MEKLKLSDFNYSLPRKLIAQYPAARRDESRLLVLERAKEKIRHRKFPDILEYFTSGDCLVLNNTKVIYARMIGKRKTLSSGAGGGKQEIFLIERLENNVFRALAKPAKKLTVDSEVFFDQENIKAKVLSDEGMVKTIRFSGNGKAGKIWEKLGKIPLPPYIKREPQALDKDRYQTVYAQEEGSSASPTAGLHFTKELLEAIKDKGVNIAYVTLHVGYGTFAPVKSEDISTHKMHKESFTLPTDAAQLINLTRSKGGRVFAVGTTSVRVLEATASKGTVSGQSGVTDLFIYPPYEFKATDVLLTNFHFPKSTLLMLVSAFSGKKLLFDAYQEAIERKYRFFSYGDAMLIL